MMGENGDKATQKIILHLHHLDEPPLKRFLIQLNDLSPLGVYSADTHSVVFDNGTNFSAFKLITKNGYSLYLKSSYFGRSYQNQELVTTLLWDRFRTTIIIALLAISIATLLGIILGMVSAANQYHWIDQSILAFSSLGISAPSFFVAIVFAIVFGYYLHDMTGLNFKGSLMEYDDIGNRYWNFKNLILPVLALAWRPIAIITQMTRNSMLDVLREDYIRTAFAKGLSHRVVFWKHALINAINPVITSVSSWFGSLLAGAYFIEIVFDIKGLGALTVNALMKFDIPVIMGASLYIASSFIFISFIVDYLYRWVDPRIRI
jgi:peptide/nickel transport system permease protein